MTTVFPLIPTNNLSDLTSASSARTNLGLGSIATQSASAVAITGGTIAGLTGFGIRSSGAAFDLTLASSEAITAGRTLSLNVGNAARTLTLSGNPTIADWFDQSVKVAASPTFAALTLTTPLAVDQGGTGRNSGVTAYSLIATGTTATGSNQTLANGLTTQILIGGGASALPVWTTATGTGAPVRQGLPAFVGFTNSDTFTNFGTKWLTRGQAVNVVTTTSTNFMLAFDMDCSDQTISSGVTDSGYRLGVRGDAYSASAGFAGTLAAQYGIWGRVGFSSGTSGAALTNAYGGRFEVLNAVAGTTITNGYGVYIDNSATVGTITNRYGVFQNGSAAINHFGGTITSVGQLTLGVASTTQGLLRLFGSGGANAHIIRAATTPAAANTYVWPSADPAASTVLTASAPAAGVVTLTWAPAGGGSQTPWTGNIDGAGFTLTGTGNITMSGQAARTFGSVRHTTSNTAGNSLTINAGGATSGATDKAGGNFTIAPGIGTGNAATSQFNIQAPAQGGATGTTDQTLVNRIVGSKTVSLTSGAAATIATLTVASGSRSGGTVFYQVEATDGTDHIVCNGHQDFSVVNKAGTFTWGTSTITEATNQVTAKSAMSNMITNTLTGSSGNLQFTSTMGGVPAMSPTTFRITVTVITNSAQAITL